MEELEDLKNKIKDIEERNRRVEADKAWEMSAFRMFAISAIIYAIAVFALMVIGNDHPLRNALIPAIGFAVSMQSLPFLKNAWIKRYLKARSDSH